MDTALTEEFTAKQTELQNTADKLYVRGELTKDECARLLVRWLFLLQTQIQARKERKAELNDKYK